VRIGLSSYAYRYAVAQPSPITGRALTASGLLEKAAAVGAEVVQYSDNLPLHAAPASDVESLLAHAQSLGVAVEFGARGLDEGRLRRYVALSRMAHARALRLVLDTADADAIQRPLQALLPHLAEAGVVLAIENHADLRGPMLADLIRRIDNRHVAVCLDTANSIGILEHPLETVHALAPLAVQVHIKDYVVEPVSIGYHVTGRPLGEGALPLDDVLRAVCSNGRDPDLFVELWMDPAPSREETLAREERWIAHSLRVLREAVWLDGASSTP